MEDTKDDFSKRKSSIKKFKKKVHLTNESRLFKIKEVLKGGNITLEKYTELIALTTQRGGSLDPEFVGKHLEERENHVVIYNRNTKLIPEETGGSSGFIIYTIEHKDHIIVCNLICILSIDNKQKISDILNEDVPDWKLKSRKKLEAQGCGDMALKDLENVVKAMLVAEQGVETAEICLESVNVEYVVGFYIKNGFVPTSAVPSEDGVIHMRKRISLKRTLEEVHHPELYNRRLVYTGTNREGNTFYSYEDGSYSYRNMDSKGRLRSVYHSNTMEYGEVPKKRRMEFDTESDEEELKLE